MPDPSVLEPNSPEYFRPTTPPPGGFTPYSAPRPAAKLQADINKAFDVQRGLIGEKEAIRASQLELIRKRRRDRIESRLWNLGTAIVLLALNHWLK